MSGLAPFDTVVLLSGGIDSAACLAFYIDQGVATSASFVAYGQPAEAEERTAARRVSKHFGVPLTEVGLVHARPVASGHIPHRNALLVISALFEIGVGPARIALGIHRGSSYPDCSGHFLEAAQRLADVTARGSVILEAPFLEWDRPTILGLCERLEVPVHLTWSCENPGPTSCGRCASCGDREQAYA